LAVPWAIICSPIFKSATEPPTLFVIGVFWLKKIIFEPPSLNFTVTLVLSLAIISPAANPPLIPPREPFLAVPAPAIC
jgi:hypothetical protein